MEAGVGFGTAAGGQADRLPPRVLMAIADRAGFHPSPC